MLFGLKQDVLFSANPFSIHNISGASGNGKRKRKAETEKLKFGNGRQKFNRLVSGQCTHRCVVVTLTYMPNYCGIIVVTASTSMHSSLISGPLAAAQTWRLL